MKTNQRPTPTAGVAKTANSASRLTSVRQRSKEEELSIRVRQTQRQSQPACERERKHEVARMEREAQAQAQQQQKRDATLRVATPTPKSTAAPRTVPLQKLIKEKPKSNIPSAKATKQPEKLKVQDTNINSETFIVEDGNTGKTAHLRLQLEHLTQLSDQDFEREFRKWLSQEGIDNKMHAHLRMHLINCFNNTSLGKLLSRASTTAAQLGHHSSCFVRSPIILALHTLVAEFLYEQNCHYTLSVFCSEMQHHHTLPNFQGRTEFRFSQEEVQQVLVAVLGKQEAETKIGRQILQHYGESQSQQCLLLILLKALLDANSTSTKTVEVQTEPAACLGICKAVDTGQLYQADELIVAGDGRTVFIGPRASNSLTGLGRQLSSLMENINNLSTPCAPPIEVISTKGLKKILHLELLERQRLLDAGKTLGPGQMASQLPVAPQQQESPVAKPAEDNIVLSSVGPIVVPPSSANVPKLPHLHEEQVATLAMMQQTLQKFQEQIKRQQPPEASMRLTLERYEALVCELSVCVHTLSNVLNLTMEQECVVGKHRGYKRGYHEGFSHGHFMGVQEGKLRVQQQQLQRQQELEDTASQTHLAGPQQTVATQTKGSSRRHASTSTDCWEKCSKAVACQTTPAAKVKPPASRTYIQWVFEMMNSESGNVFLERAEISMQKALTMQRDRLDEIYMIKLRHHAEMLRIHYRQSCWRTLCRNLELDSHSDESRELVQKIVKILERYEVQNQQLAEKIRSAEKAAEMTATLEMGWPSAASKSNSTIKPQTIKPIEQLVISLPPPPHIIPAHLKELRAVYAAKTSASVAATAPITDPAPVAAPFAAVATAVAPSSATDPVTAPAPAPAVAPVSTPAPAPSTTNVEPPKPTFHDAATNTNLRQRAHISPVARPTTLPSFHEALLSAKNRMLQLEKESDVLEHSFLDYLERARAHKQTQMLNIRNSCARERQHIHRTLESFRDWQRRMRLEELQLPLALPEVTAPVYNVSEQETQESYPFTNAITDARRKLFSELQATISETPTPPAPAAMVQQVDLEQERLSDQVQTETQQLFNRVEATLARVGNHPSMQLQNAESQMPLYEADSDLISSDSTLSMLCDVDGADGEADDRPLTPLASTKLQRSMAKMQQLFGGQTEVQNQTKPSRRPWSAPTLKLTKDGKAARPHTAPSRQTGATSSAGMFDALSDTANSSSIDTRPTVMRDVYAPSTSRSSSSSTLSHSVDFWKRMNL